MEKEYYTVREASEILELREQTIRDYITRGRIQSEKIYNSTVISKEEINEQLFIRNINKKEVK